MFEVDCLDLVKQTRFTKIFYGIKKLNDFKRKCKYSKKIKIIGISDYSKFYD